MVLYCSVRYWVFPGSFHENMQMLGIENPVLEKKNLLQKTSLIWTSSFMRVIILIAKKANKGFMVQPFHEEEETPPTLSSVS